MWGLWLKEWNKIMPELQVFEKSEREWRLLSPSFLFLLWMARFPYEFLVQIHFFFFLVKMTLSCLLEASGESHLQISLSSYIGRHCQGWCWGNIEAFPNHEFSGEPHNQLWVLHLKALRIPWVSMVLWDSFLCDSWVFRRVFCHRFYCKSAHSWKSSWFRFLKGLLLNVKVCVLFLHFQ